MEANRKSLYLAIFLLAILSGVLASGLDLHSATLEKGENLVERSIFSVSSQEAETPVFLVTIETLRADHLGPCYGYERETAPNMCEFAEDSIKFKNAYAPASNTHSTIPAMFTSTPPNAFGINFDETVDQKAPVMTETLREEGYYTSAYSDTPELNEEHGFLQGFQEVQETSYAEDKSMIFRLRDIEENHFSFIFFRHQAHAPYEPEPDYVKWGDPPEQGVEIDPFEDTIETPNATLQDAIDAYDAEIRQADSRVGKVLTHLKEESLYEESLIIITSDHGEGFMERGELSHSTTPYEEQIRVPLFVKPPNNKHSGKVVEDPVSLIDIPPTIYGITDTEPESEQYGESLLPVERKSEGLVYATDPTHSEWSIRNNSMKYMLLNTGRYCTQENVNPRERMYDLKYDPSETENMIYEHPEKAGKLREGLCKIYLDGRDLAAQPDEAELTNEMEEKLRELGYIE